MFPHEENPVKFPELPPEEQLNRAKKFSFTTTQDFNFIVKRADGPFVWDAQGKKYIDFHCGASSTNFGHSPAFVRDAIYDQFRRGLVDVPDQDYPLDVTTEAKELLCKITPGDFPKKVFFGNSGTEAVEAAIKLCLAKRPERKKFISFQGAFHGRTGYSLALNASKPIHREHFPKALDVIHLPFPERGKNDFGFQFIASLGDMLMEKDIFPKDINAVFIELVQGEGGINVADEASVKALGDFCREENIYLVVDEIQTGFWRTGKLFASDYYGIAGDIICVGKSVAGGPLPVSAAIGRADLDFDRFGRHSNTFGGYALGAAAVLATIKFALNIDKSVIERNVELLQRFAPEGLGLMRRWRFNNAEDRNAFTNEAERRGILLLNSGEKNVRFMPSVNIDTELFKETLNTLRSIPIPHIS